MWYAVIAVLVGVAAGLAAGGRFRNLASRDFRAWALLPIGVVAQLLPDAVPALEDAAFVFLALSYACLAAFALWNLHIVGMAVVTVGLVLNLVPVLTNEGMPVRAEAAVAAGIADWDEIRRVEFDPKHHLETDDDRFMVLADVIPVRPLGEVLSFGDLVMAVGIADVLFRLLRPAGARRRRERDDGSPPVGTDRAVEGDAVVIDLTAPAPADDDVADLRVRRSG